MEGYGRACWFKTYRANPRVTTMTCHAFGKWFSPGWQRQLERPQWVGAGCAVLNMLWTVQAAAACAAFLSPFAFGVLVDLQQVAVSAGAFSSTMAPAEPTLPVNGMIVFCSCRPHHWCCLPMPPIRGASQSARPVARPMTQGCRCLDLDSIQACCRWRKRSSLPSFRYHFGQAQKCQQLCQNLKEVDISFPGAKLPDEFWRDHAWGEGGSSHVVDHIAPSIFVLAALRLVPNAWNSVCVSRFPDDTIQDKVGVGVQHNWSAARCSGDPSRLDLFQQSLQSEQCWPKWSIELVGFVILRKSMGSGIDRCQGRSAKLTKHGGGQEHQLASHPLGLVTGEFVGFHCSLDRYQDFLTPVRMWSKDDLVLVHV